MTKSLRFAQVKCRHPIVAGLHSASSRVVGYQASFSCAHDDGINRRCWEKFRQDIQDKVDAVNDATVPMKVAVVPMGSSRQKAECIEPAMLPSP